MVRHVPENVLACCSSRTNCLSCIVSPNCLTVMSPYCSDVASVIRTGAVRFEYLLENWTENDDIIDALPVSCV